MTFTDLPVKSKFTVAKLFGKLAANYCFDFDRRVKNIPLYILILTTEKRLLVWRRVLEGDEKGGQCLGV
jgi:hypothetical protein